MSAKWVKWTSLRREKDTLAFIEVKTRTSTEFGPPQLAVTDFKQRQLSKVALNFLKEKNYRRCESEVRCGCHPPWPRRRRN